MDLKEALTKAQNICGKQERCKKDLIEKLTDWEVSHDYFEKIINSLIHDNFINETRFATSFVNDKFKFNKWGKIKIRFHLVQKGIEESTIQESLDKLDAEAYLTTLRNLLISKHKSLKATDKQQTYRKLLQFSYNKGYAFEDSNQIIKEIVENNN